MNNIKNNTVAKESEETNMLVKGDKIVSQRNIFNISKGEIFEVTNAENNYVTFEKETEHEKFISTMSLNMVEEYFEKYFEKYEEPNKAQLEKIDELLKGLERFKQTLLELKETIQNNCDGDCPCDECCGDCDECEVEYEIELELEEDECLDTDLDCDDCNDYDCPFNTNNGALESLAGKLNKNTLNAILSIKDLDEALKNINNKERI